MKQDNKKGSNDTYPTTVEVAYEYLNNYKMDPKTLQRTIGHTKGPSGRMSFLQEGNENKEPNSGVKLPEVPEFFS